jgi:hypothetical protein
MKVIYDPQTDTLSVHLSDVVVGDSDESLLAPGSPVSCGHGGGEPPDACRRAAVDREGGATRREDDRIKDLPEAGNLYESARRMARFVHPAVVISILPTP